MSKQDKNPKQKRADKTPNTQDAHAHIRARTDVLSAHDSPNSSPLELPRNSSSRGRIQTTDRGYTSDQGLVTRSRANSVKRSHSLSARTGGNIPAAAPQTGNFTGTYTVPTTVTTSASTAVVQAPTTVAVASASTSTTHTNVINRPIPTPSHTVHGSHNTRITGGHLSQLSGSPFVETTVQGAGTVGAYRGIRSRGCGIVVELGGVRASQKKKKKTKQTNRSLLEEFQGTTDTGTGTGTETEAETDSYQPRQKGVRFSLADTEEAVDTTQLQYLSGTETILEQLTLREPYQELKKL